MEYFGILWDFMGFMGIFLDFMGFMGIFPDFMGLGTSGFFLGKVHGIFRTNALKVGGVN